MSTVAIVTGAASGLGLKTVEVFLQQGFKVSAWDLNPVGIFSPNLIQFMVDVTDSESIARALTETISVFSKVDVLVNLAGIVVFSPLINHTLEDWQKVVNVNLTGTFNASRQVSKFMENGVIILVASICAYQASQNLVAYAATKGAVVGLAMPMARDLAFKNTRVVCISPGTIATPMTAFMPEELRTRYSKEIPCGRMGSAEEFAHSVLFAINNKYLNGCNLDLNGGLVHPNL